MNFLAHLWLADRAGAELSGAILGDLVRGRDLDEWPDPVADSIRLHRRIDAATDAHPIIETARARYEQGHRRYAGIILDVVCDHLLIRHWERLSDEPMDAFMRRSAVAVARQAPLFQQAGAKPPDATRFDALLHSYADPEGVDHALARIATRLRKPEPLLVAAGDWARHAEALSPDIPKLMRELSRKLVP